MNTAAQDSAADALHIKGTVASQGVERTQAVYTKAGDTDVIKFEKSTLPKPDTHEVTLKVGASGINFADILARQGLYQDAPPFPSVVGYEVAGVVVNQGEFVGKKHGDLIGKRVFGLTRFGGYADYINVPVEQLFLTPKTLTDAEAASLPVAYLTAYQLISVMGALKPSETVLIHNAGGGVGLAQLDMARHIGATTIGTASTAKHEFLKERGFDHLIDYTKEDWRKRVLELTDGFGVELVTDPLGGESFSKSYEVLRNTGRLGMFGVSAAADSTLMGKVKLAKTALSMPMLKIHPINLMMQNRCVFGVNLGHMWEENDKIKAWMAQIMAGVEAGWTRPYVGKTFSFDKIALAHAFIEQRKNIGKVVLVFND